MGLPRNHYSGEPWRAAESIQRINIRHRHESACNVSHIEEHSLTYLGFLPWAFLTCVCPCVPPSPMHSSMAIQRLRNTTLATSQDLYTQPISRLVEWITAATRDAPNLNLEVFVHKAEKLPEDDKIENFRQIQERVADRLLDISALYESVRVAILLPV